MAEPISTAAATLGGAGIQAGGALAGGLIGLIGARMANKSQEKMHKENMRMQREFAQNSIKWRVDDAKRAGIHPLAALGSQATYYTPTSTQSHNELSDIAGGVADSANSIGRSMQILALDNQDSQNKLLQAQTDYYNAKALAEINKVNTEGKGTNYGEQQSWGQNGSLKLPNDQRMQILEDSWMAFGMRVDALTDAYSKDAFQAKKDFQSALGPVMSKGLTGVDESRRYTGSIDSRPQFDLSKYSDKEIEALANALLYKTPFLNKAVNAGITEKGIIQFFKQRNSALVNKLLTGETDLVKLGLAREAR